MIEAMVLLKRPVHLTIRGNGEETYVNSLKALAGNAGEKISFERAVPVDQVSSYAARHDIGLFVPKLESAQMRAMLPNKIFEYIMGGLMVVASDAEDIVQLFQQHHCGRALPHPMPKALADLLEIITMDDVKATKEPRA